jgi:hypothetical protein
MSSAPWPKFLSRVSFRLERGLSSSFSSSIKAIAVFAEVGVTTFEKEAGNRAAAVGQSG